MYPDEKLLAAPPLFPEPDAQAAALLAGSRWRQVSRQLGLSTGLASDEDMARLAAAHRLQAVVKAAARLLTDQALDPAALGHGGQAMLLRETGEPDLAALEAAITAAQEEAGTIIDRALADAAPTAGDSERAAVD